MISTILSWTVMCIVFLSFGEIAVRIWNNITGDKDSYSAFDKCWMGISFLGIILMYISIFCPINIYVLSIVVTISLAYWIINRAQAKSYLCKIYERISSSLPLQKLMFSVAFITVMIYALSAPLIYDEGLYHIQTMQWTEKYKTILGLGNLHGRLAFNSSFLLLSTLFNYHPESYETFFSANSLALLILSFWLIIRIGKANHLGMKLGLCFILITSVFSLGTDISSTSTDILSNIFIIYLLTSLTIDKRAIHNSALKIVLMAAFCITLKLSSAIILLSVFLVLWALYRKGEKRIIIYSITLGALIAIPWIIRFIMLTGYIVYPFPAIDLLSVDWKIPFEIANIEKDAAYAWARIPWLKTTEVMDMKFSEWFPIWLGRLSNYRILLYILALLSPLMLVLHKYRVDKKAISLWLVAIMGVLFGVFTAPDFRFVFGFIVSAIAIPLMNTKITINKNIESKLLTTASVLTIVAILGLTYIASSQINTYQKKTERSLFSLLYKPQPTNLFQERSKTEFHTIKMKNTSIFIPQGTNQCFDQQIPCTPYYSTNLELRGEDVRDGFRIKQ